MVFLSIGLEKTGKFLNLFWTVFTFLNLAIQLVLQIFYWAHVWTLGRLSQSINPIVTMLPSLLDTWRSHPESNMGQSVELPQCRKYPDIQNSAAGVVGVQLTINCNQGSLTKQEMYSQNTAPFLPKLTVDTMQFDRRHSCDRYQIQTLSSKR